MIAGMGIEVIGDPPTPPFFLVTNHLSYVDIAALRATVKGIFVAKAEVNEWFLAGRIVRDMGVIFIDRNNRRDIPRAGAEIIRKLNEGEGVIVFPEGTSTKGEDILPFNSSFFCRYLVIHAALCRSPTPESSGPSPPAFATPCPLSP